LLDTVEDILDNTLFALRENLFSFLDFSPTKTLEASIFLISPAFLFLASTLPPLVGLFLFEIRGALLTILPRAVLLVTPREHFGSPRFVSTSFWLVFFPFIFCIADFEFLRASIKTFFDFVVAFSFC